MPESGPGFAGTPSRDGCRDDGASQSSMMARVSSLVAAGSGAAAAGA
jgi:hypothetical protein